MTRRGALEVETSASTPVQARVGGRARHSPTTRRRALGLSSGLIDRFKGHRRLASTASSSQLSTTGSSPPTSTDDPRRVLAPLHVNLRRLPSRQGIERRRTGTVTSSGSGSSTTTAGTKRKRAASGVENGSHGRRGVRGPKRRRGSSGEIIDGRAESESVMDVDDGDGDGAEDGTQDYLLYQANDRHLRRLRKDHLIHLFRTVGLEDSPDDLTKQGLVDAIIAARGDVDDEEGVTLPPSSPRNGDDASSVYSSDNDDGSEDGNVAAGEETDMNQLASPRPGSGALKRRVTYHNVLGEETRPGTRNRTMSMGVLNQSSPTPYRKAARQVDSPTALPRTRKRTASMRSSHTASMASSSKLSTSGSSSLPSPPATRRLRGQKSSEHATSSSSSTSRKGKPKQVDFADQVSVSSHGVPEAELSELSELTESDGDTTIKSKVGPSPRRLRSRPRVGGEGSGSISAKPSLDEEMAAQSDDGAGDEEEEEEEEDVDQLVGSSASPTPQPRRTPLKRRLRPRKMQTYTPPSDEDGDDEREELGGEEGDEEEGDGTDEEEQDDADDPTPRKLRSGRVVQAEEVVAPMESELSDMSVDGEEVDEEATSVEEDEEEQEGSEVDDANEDVDWSTATKSSLQRLRRDELVRLSETRSLDTTGTKPQLADALIKWARAATQPSAPSSTATVTGAPAPATVRPGPATARPPRRSRQRSDGSKKTTPTPVLLREEHVHEDEPRTPPPSGPASAKDEDIELDLAGLGLEDREISYGQLTKLEKIGSGGFKDVFIGKFKGRKVAIAEFRGTLSSMDIKELKLLGGFNHKNIVRFMGVSIPPEENRNTPVMIVSELCENGDLFDYLRNVPAPPLHTVLKIALDIARGLEYLHTRQPSVIHRDCKSSNILITARGSAKIADFGLAKVKQTARSMVRSLVGTVNWQAPELWHPSPKYNFKVDVFAAGVVFWEMMQWHVKDKKYPWEGMNEHAIYDAVGAKRLRPSTHGLRRIWCPELVDLVERMWAHDHNDRPDMTEVVHELEKLAKLYRKS